MFTLRLCRTPNKPSTLRIVRLLHGVGWCLGMHFCIKTTEKGVLIHGDGSMNEARMYHGI
jgi:hypothetical protein